jgi:hypothetical protein
MAGEKRGVSSRNQGWGALLTPLSNLLSVHGLFCRLVVTFLAKPVRGDSGLRTAIFRMLVFHRGTSALPFHWWPPCEVRILHPHAPRERPTFFPRTTPAGGRGHAPRENALEKCPSTGSSRAQADVFIRLHI